MTSDPTSARPHPPRTGLRQIAMALGQLLRDPSSRVLLACSVLLGLGGSFVAPYLSLFGTREVGLSLRVFGGFMTLTVAANISISSLLARRSDHMRSRRPVLILGSAAGAVGYLGYALVREPWWLLVIGMLVLGIGSLTSLYVLGELGGSETQVGIIFSLAPLFELPLMLYLGFLATRMASERLIRLALALAVLYYGALTLVQAPWQIYPLQALSAAIVAVTSGVAITFFQNKLPGQFGTATHLYVNAMRIGSTSGYLLFGSVAARFGHRGAYFACSVLALLALLSASIFESSRALPRPVPG